MTSFVMDLTSQLATHNFYAVADISEYETLTIQIIGLGGTCNIAGTNNGGEVTGVINGTPKDATDFNAVQAVKLSTGAAVTAVTDTALYRITPISFKYLRLGDGSSFTATKILVYCTKTF